MGSKADDIRDYADDVEEIEYDLEETREKLGRLEESVLSLRTLAMECEVAYNFVSMEKEWYRDEIPHQVGAALESLLYRTMRLFDFVTSDEALTDV